MSYFEIIETSKGLSIKLSMKMFGNSVAFYPLNGVEVQNWIHYFEQKFSKFNLGNELRVKNIPRFLKGDACVDYINKMLFTKDWEKLKYKLMESYL